MMTLVIICLAIFFVGISCSLYRHWLIPADDSEWEIEVRPYKYLDHYYEAVIYRDGKQLDTKGLCTTLWGARYEGYEYRRNVIRQSKKREKFKSGKTKVVIPAKSATKSVVMKSTDYTRLKDKFSKNQLTQEQFEREIGKLLIEEEKKEAV